MENMNTQAAAVTWETIGARFPLLLKRQTVWKNAVNAQIFKYMILKSRGK